MEENDIEKEAWAQARSIDTHESYLYYIEEYPQGKNVEVASRILQELNLKQRDEIIKGLSEDRKAYPLSYIKACS